MNRQRPLIVALALVAGLAGAGAARAHGAPAVNWSVTIGVPAVTPPRVVLPGVVLLPPPAVPHVRVQPVVHPRPGYREPTRWDIDGDGIPNHRDRRYNPRWDVDGDGIPNRRDRYDGAPRHDRDRDGVPDRHDPYPNHPGYPGHPGRGR